MQPLSPGPRSESARFRVAEKCAPSTVQERQLDPADDPQIWRWHETWSCAESRRLNEQGSSRLNAKGFKILTMNDRTPGDRIRQRRNELGMSQQALADKVGVTKASISNWENSNDLSDIKVGHMRSLCRALHCTDEYILFGTYSVREPQFGYEDKAVRRIVLLTYSQAGTTHEYVADYEVGAGMGTIEVEADAPIGPYAFGLELIGDSMFNPGGSDSFAPGDRVIIDPDLPLKPGNFVYAVQHDGEGTFKQYRDRGVDQDGRPVFELHPLNTNHSPIVANAEHPVRIVGSLCEQRIRKSYLR